MKTPYAVAIDSAGRVYIADHDNHRVLIFNDLTDTTADLVLGQTNFTTRLSPAPTANTLKNPSGVAVDSAGRLYVTDKGNNRVLIFNDLTDTTADQVLGQTNFTSNAAPNPPTATSMNNPFGIAVDSAGRLFVGELLNNRVLVFNDLTDDTADMVLGQTSFTANTAPNPPTVNSMREVQGVTRDTAGVVYVADRGNHRVLVFNDLTDTTPDVVLGQAIFTTRLFPAPTDSSMNVPTGVAVDAAGRILVTDFKNNRMLVFNAPAVIAAVADTSLPVQKLFVAFDTNPILTADTVTVASGGESFVQVNIASIDTTSPATGKNLRDSAVADSQGLSSTDDATLIFPLMNKSSDTIAMKIWTTQSSIKVFTSRRSDTASIEINSMPGAFEASKAGQTAFGASIIMVEFADSSGTILGDSVTTTNLGDTLSYNMVYNLSETTTRLYANTNFDTSPGSTSFSFYFADTYGGKWTRDTTVTTTVETGVNGGIKITVAGITKDLPGGLGAGGLGSGSGSGGCIIGTSPTPGVFKVFFRHSRDSIMEFRVGRFLVSLYYSLFGY